jgi:hypothetical protein
MLGTVRHSVSACNDEAALLPIWTIELDQAQDRVRIATDSAVTGVNHLYYIIEHLVFRRGYTRGLGRRSGYFAQRTDTRDFVDRIGGFDEMGTEAAQATRRDNYSVQTAATLSNLFEASYGRHIMRLLSQWPPLACYFGAFSALQEAIRSSESPQLERLLYGGQGVSNVLDVHVANLDRRKGEGDPVALSPEAMSARERFRNLAVRRSSYVHDARDLAVDSLLAELSGGTSIGDGLRAEILRLIELCRTVAFQAALTCTVLEVADYCVTRLRADDPDLDDRAVIQEVVDEYAERVFPFFKPSHIADLERILYIFRGSGLFTDGRLDVLPESNASYRNVVMGTSELQPDAWPHYRYLFLELWNPTHAIAQDLVARELQTCRRQSFRSLYHRVLSERARAGATTVDELATDDRRAAFEDAYSRMNALVMALSDDALSQAEMEETISVDEPNDEEVQEVS